MEKTIVTVLGIVFVAIGLLGFVTEPILGIFAVDPMHNIIHLLSGVLGLAAVAMGAGATRTYARVFGVLYALVAVVGLFTTGDMLLGLFAVNFADDLLHVVLAVLLLYVGFASRPATEAPAM